MKKLLSFMTGVLTAALLSLPTFAEAAEEAVEAAALSGSAVSAILVNADTGEAIYENNADEERAIASTTKIMTALLTLEAGQLDRRFTVDAMAIRVEGTSMGLSEGDIVTRRALCYGMLLPSGNDAANAAAVSVSGSLTAFADRMNEKAAMLGMTHTHFVNPSGLDADGHYSTARDMAILTRAALKNEEFRKICGLSSAALSFGNPPSRRTLYNSNKLLARYEGCIGVKTGFTDNARRCLVSAAQREGVTLIAVTLNAADDWNDHTRMLDHGFTAVTAREITPDSFALEVAGGTSETVTVSPERTLTLGLTDESAAALDLRYYVPAFVYGGIAAGEQLGTAEIYYNGELIERIALVAEEACPRAESKKTVWERFAEAFKK
ncbi:MAG: D-alanyl-D-alanine carboxypeptidase [Bacteroides sp.]|nr:D-alanyl-D-alanine carboxypeptidase [Eubacterium sp.]MCM1419019.1 D-alanyl-D-alanine carboxypeptidase [Roseburia sp.]MCM1462859.1 D-alanyl-D-alanine carboxypeptidase [Bacteroides sp.]